MRQLKAADLIVVNKIDLLAADARPALHVWIESVAGTAPRFGTTQAVVPLAMLSGLAMPHPESAAAHALAHDACEGDAAHDPSHAHVHHHTNDHTNDRPHDAAAPDHGAVFETWSCRPDHRFEPAALQAWLRGPPAGLLRLKGVLRTTVAEGGEGWSEIQFAGRHGTLRRATEPRGGAALVAIGLTDQLPTDALNRFFGARGASA